MKIRLRDARDILDLNLCMLKEHISSYNTNLLINNRQQAYYDLSLIIHNNMAQCPISLEGILSSCERCVDFNYCIYRFLRKVVK